MGIKADGVCENVVIPKIKNGSVITIGKTRSLKIKIDHHFNWFQKKMIGLCFGLEVEDYDE